MKPPVVISDYETMVAFLAATREAKKLTFAEVARRMGRTYLQQVFNWLNGGAECRARRLFAMANALGYDLALVPRAEHAEPRTAAGHPAHTPGDSQ